MLEQLTYILESLWSWFLNTGINLAIIILIGVLIPRVGRLVMRIARHRIEKENDEESSKNKLAFAGVGLYIVQIIAYFFLIVAFLQQIGFSLAGAAIPATVASAAVGFGAQSIIADFLAGFFILTEKQFGVGDWVRFEGGGVEAEGTVVEVTMRATTIRTISQQTIIIPNSAAKVCINSSNEWSRAVVSIPVPMLGSDDIAQVIERSENAARRALAEDQAATVVIGELDVHPAVDIQPPTVVGMPWLVTMRFMVQVTAGNQWLVERAVRTQIIDEFWDEYGSATTVSGALVDKLSLDGHAAEAPTEMFGAPGKSYPRKPLIDVPVDSLEKGTPTVHAGAGSAASPAAGRLIDVPPTTPEDSPAAETAEVTASGEIRPTPKGTHPNRPDVSMSVPPKNPEDTDETRVIPVTDDGTADDDGHGIGLFRADTYEKWWQRTLSFGGRTRMSTGAMIMVLLLLLVAKAFTVEPSEEWERRNTSTEEVITTPVEPSPEQETSEQPTRSPEQETPTAEPTVTGTPTNTAEQVTPDTADTTSEPEAGTSAPTAGAPATTTGTTQPQRPLQQPQQSQQQTPTQAPAAPTATVGQQPAPAGT